MTNINSMLSQLLGGYGNYGNYNSTNSYNNTDSSAFGLLSQLFSQQGGIDQFTGGGFGGMRPPMGPGGHRGHKPPMGPPPQMLQDNFSEIDTNGDGLLSEDELNAFTPADRPAGAPEFSEEKKAAMTSRLLEKGDTDGDGSLSEEEVSQLPPPPPPPFRGQRGGFSSNGGFNLQSILPQLLSGFESSSY